jgi:hypothetical protein
MRDFLFFSGGTACAILLGAGLLHLIPRLGAAGRRASDWFCRAPGLDLLITYFTVAPLVVGPALFGWKGLAAAGVGQDVGMILWQWMHELAHRDAIRGPRIVKVINARVGRVRNHAAMWTTAIVTPLFWVVRLAEIFVYRPLTWLVDLPKYDSGEWVNVSRHKFAGLVGHDMIWCLYCDWMTGVWSLATEMLRNVESFWCPIRFCSDKKCANCRHDFPDVVSDWVDARGTMAEVIALLEEKYPPDQHPRAWFGHPVRITVNGQDPLHAGSTSKPREAVSAGS